MHQDNYIFLPMWYTNIVFVLQIHTFYSRCLERTRKLLQLLFFFEILRVRTCTIPLPSNEFVLIRILPPLPPPEYDPPKLAPLALKVPSMSKVSLILRKKMPPPRPPAPPVPLPPLLPVHKKIFSAASWRSSLWFWSSLKIDQSWQCAHFTRLFYWADRVDNNQTGQFR